MTDEQRRGIAAGFLHILKTTPAAYEAWLATPKNDTQAICALIARAMNLAVVPSSDDLNAMASHIDVALQADVAALLETDSRTPRHVGFIAFMQNAGSTRELSDAQLRELLALSSLTATRP